MFAVGKHRSEFKYVLKFKNIKSKKEPTVILE